MPRAALIYSPMHKRLVFKAIYSEAFNALPKPARDYFYLRLWDVLS